VSEPEHFLSRWARLKREAAETPDAAAPDAAADGSRTAEPAGETQSPRATEPAFDISTLPPIESITATTDIRAFLAPGVPPELTRAALRRAWVADPAIRDFVGIAENQWDFNDPNAIPGFGALGPLDDVRRLVAQVIGEPQRKPADSAVGTEKSSAAEDLSSDSIANKPRESGATESHLSRSETTQQMDAPATIGQGAEIAAAPQQYDANDASRATADWPVKRTHGGALPK
jgi:Protein of unknown function (DUF3306)